MTSMFDQYEQASQRFKGTVGPTVRPEMVRTIICCMYMNSVYSAYEIVRQKYSLFVTSLTVK